MARFKVVGFLQAFGENIEVNGDITQFSGSRWPEVRKHNSWRASLSPRLAAVLDQVRRFAEMLHGKQPGFRQLLDRALSENPDRASTAIAQLGQKHDPALAAITWSFFWIRQGELFQARNELEVIANSGKTQSFWGGMAVMTLGEINLELGETQKGLGLIRRARQILGEPP